MPRGLLSLFLTLALVAASPRAEAGDAVSLMAGDDFKPFVDQALPAGGLATEIVTAAFARAGRSATVAWVPWTEAYARTLESRADATFPYQATPERAAEMLYSEPLFVTSQRLFWNHRTGRPATDLADLTGATLCLPMGYTPPPELIDLIHDGLVRRAQPADMTACFRLLKEGEVDYVVTNPHQANDGMAAVGMPLRHAGISAFAVNRNSLHLIVSRSHPNGAALIKAFNDGLAALKADGTYDRIVRKHLGSGGM